MYNVILHVKPVLLLPMINVLYVRLIEKKIQMISVFQKKVFMKIMNQFQERVINVVNHV